jgi:hypothetical protein
MEYLFRRLILSPVSGSLRWGPLLPPETCRRLEQTVDSHEKFLSSSAALVNGEAQMGKFEALTVDINFTSWSMKFLYIFGELLMARFTQCSSNSVVCAPRLPSCTERLQWINHGAAHRTQNQRWANNQTNVRDVDNVYHFPPLYLLITTLVCLHLPFNPLFSHPKKRQSKELSDCGKSDR